VTHAVNPHIFRAYDIRGVVDVDLTDDVYRTLGQAVGTTFVRQGRRRLVVGRDARLSSPRFQRALIAGLRATGCDVIDIGEVPTPVMYFAVAHLGADGGAVVSASHNPPEYNGLKLRRFEPRYGGEPLTSEEVQALERLANSGDFERGSGSLEQADVGEAYVASVRSHLQLPRPVKVVLDAGNGVGGPLGLRALAAIGCEVVPLYCEPDGRFPNHHPDPLKAENLRDLQRVVREQGADLGIGLDGDGDRLGVVDGRGEMVFADRYLIAIATYLLAQQRGPVVFDVKCSALLGEAIAALGGTPIMWKTGYPNLSAKMREVAAVFGGELSGHVIAPLERHYFDDGTFAGGFLLYALAQLGQRLDEVLAPYPLRPSIDEGRIPFPEEHKFAVIEYLRAVFEGSHPVLAIDGVRVDFGDGWGLVRASNTEPAITTRFEATSLARAEEIRALMLGKVEAFRNQGRVSR
jgi:phosphomannomutase